MQKLKKKQNKQLSAKASTTLHRNTVSIFGYPVDIITKENAVDFAIDNPGAHIVTINPEIIAAADDNLELASIIKQAGLVLPESTGIMLALKKKGIFNAEKIPGIEFSEALIQKCIEKDLKVAFLGGSPDVIDKLDFPGLNVVYKHHGYFEYEDVPNIIQRLKEAEPSILFVGLGCPKQEFFINNIRSHLKKTSMIGVGGSFDVWAKKVKRAPVLFRIFGLEWFYRLITQPQRFRRMFPVLPLFFLRIVFDRSSNETIKRN